MSEAIKKERKFTKQTPEALVKEFGQIRIRRIAEACFPSDEAIKNVEKLSAELAELKSEFSSVPAKFQPMAQKAIDGVEFKLHVAMSKLGNPDNVSSFDKNLLSVAARRLLKADKANIASIARLLLDNISEFPVAGTKY